MHYSGLHDAVKQRKHGYGKALDHACRELRFNRLTREEAAAVAAHYRDVDPADAQQFFDWLGISGKDFWEIIDRHASPGAKDAVADSKIPTGPLAIPDTCAFTLTPLARSRKRS